MNLKFVQEFAPLNSSTTVSCHSRPSLPSLSRGFLAMLHRFFVEKNKPCYQVYDLTGDVPLLTAILRGWAGLNWHFWLVIGLMQGLLNSCPCWEPQMSVSPAAEAVSWTILMYVCCLLGLPVLTNHGWESCF